MFYVMAGAVYLLWGIDCVYVCFCVCIYLLCEKHG